MINIGGSTRVGSFVDSGLRQQVLDNQNKIDTLTGKVGDLTILKTTSKNTIVEAINEHDDKIGILKKSVGVSIEEYPRIDPEVDDTARIQRAIDAISALGGGNLIIPKLNLTVSSTILWKSNVNLIGAGKGNSIITLTTAGITLINATECNNISFTGVEFVGTGTTSSAAGQSYTERLLYIDACTNVTIANCKFSNCTIGVQATNNSKRLLISLNIFENIVGYPGAFEGYAILANNANHLTISDNHFYEIRRHAIYLSAGTSDAVVSNNNIENMYGTAIQVFSKQSLSQPWCNNIIVIGNKIKNVFDTEANVSNGIIFAGQVSNSAMIGNVGTGIAMNMLKLDGTDGRPIDILIQGNIMSGCYKATVAGAYLSGENVIFANNEIICDPAKTNQYGIHVASSDKIRLINNVVKNAGSYGVKISANVTDIVLMGVTLLNTGPVSDDTGTLRSIYDDGTQWIVNGKSLIYGDVTLHSSTVLRLSQRSSNPSTLGNGQIWYDNNTNTLKAVVNGQVKTISVS
jgi:hypothetical protein